MAAPIPPTGGRAPATWQPYVRNLDWFVTQASLREEACISGGVAHQGQAEQVAQVGTQRRLPAFLGPTLL